MKKQRHEVAKLSAEMLKTGGTTEGNKICFDCLFENCPSNSSISLPVQKSQVHTLRERVRHKVYEHVRLQ